LTASFAVILILSLIGSAAAATRSSVVPKRGLYEADGALDSVRESNGGVDQHGTSQGHLPGRVNNVERVGRLRVTNLTGGIADVAYHDGYAYLNRWHPYCGEPATEEDPGTPGHAGTVVVDVSNPASPRKVSFLPAGPHDYVTEGAQVFHMNTPRFTGDVYVVAHESCDAEGQGGISLWDVTDPTDPWPLTRHFGDRTLGGDLFAHDVHSAMGWQYNGRAFVVGVDNFEQGTGDVDIFEVTDPGQPVHLKSFGLNSEEAPPGMEVAQGNLANGANAFLHDMWLNRLNLDGDPAKEVAMMMSYWDAGWILLDVTDPENPVFVDQSDYDNPDPEAQHLDGAPFTAEGNAHQGEWSSNDKWFMGTDEDFGPSRVQMTTDDAGSYSGGEFSWTVPIADEYEDGVLNGPVVWGGSACPEDVDGDGTSDAEQVPDADDYTVDEGEEKILIATRGTCFFSQKVESGENKGWDAVIVANHHAGTLNGLNPDAYLCGSLGHEYEPTINGLCVGHRAAHEFFDDTPEYEGPETGPHMPPLGTEGDTISASSQFDGWGYLQQLDADTLEQVDTFAPPKVHDPDCASDCGTMSIHEIATDPRSGVNLGYVSWYGLGLRVVKFGENGIRQKGVYMDIGGNDFWGVDVWERGNKRPLILMSDRDSGLWIFKYTGPE
jgi:hypothetical protein